MSDLHGLLAELRGQGVAIYSEPRTFVDALKTVRRELHREGKHIGVLSDNKVFIAVPDSFLPQNFRKGSGYGASIDVVVERKQIGRGAKAVPHVQLSEGQLRNLLKQVSDYELRSICFQNHNHIYFTTAEAYKRMLINHERQAQKAEAAAQVAQVIHGTGDDGNGEKVNGQAPQKGQRVIDFFAGMGPVNGAGKKAPPAPAPASVPASLGAAVPVGVEISRTVVEEEEEAPDHAVPHEEVERDYRAAEEEERAAAAAPAGFVAPPIAPQEPMPLPGPAVTVAAEPIGIMPVAEPEAPSPPPVAATEIPVISHLPTFSIVKDVWSDLGDGIRNGKAVNSVIQLSGNIAGILLSVERAREMGYDEGSFPSLADEGAWKTDLFKRDMSFVAVDESAAYIDAGDAGAFYAPVGFIKNNLRRFEEQIRPDQMKILLFAHRQQTARLLVSYWGRENPFSLGTFNDRKTSVVRGMNGVRDESNHGGYEIGSPIALTHGTVVKALAFPGLPPSTADLEIAQVSGQGFAAAWKKVSTKFPPTAAIVYTTGGHTITVVSPDAAGALQTSLLAHSPQPRAMLEKVRAPKPAAVPQPVPPPGPAEPPFRRATVVVETPVAAPKPAAPNGAIAQMMLVAEMIKKLRSASEQMIERQHGADTVLAVGAELSPKFTGESLEQLAAIYDTLRDPSEPEPKYSIVPYAGSAAAKADILVRAFAATGTGTITILKSDELTVVIGNNRPFVDFVTKFTI